MRSQMLGADASAQVEKGNGGLFEADMDAADGKVGLKVHRHVGPA